MLLLKLEGIVLENILKIYSKAQQISIIVRPLSEIISKHHYQQQ